MVVWLPGSVAFSLYGPETLLGQGQLRKRTICWRSREKILTEERSREILPLKKGKKQEVGGVRGPEHPCRCSRWDGHSDLL